MSSCRSRTIHAPLALLAALVLSACGDSPARESSTDRDDPNAPADAEGRVIVCLGDSLTAGYGVAPEEAWPALVQRRIDDEGLPWRVVNAGVSGDTTRGGLSRLSWALRSGADVLIVALGGNDALRGVDPDATKANLAAILEQARGARPELRILLAGMKAPPNMGRAYADRFESIFAELADEHDVALVPFLLEGVGGVRRLNQPDGVHPTAEGQEVLAENVWDELEDLLAD